MLIDPPFVIPSSNLSLAWGHALCRVVESPGSQRETPILVSIGDFGDIGEPDEVPEIRTALDQTIAFAESDGRGALVYFRLKQRRRQYSLACFGRRIVPAPLIDSLIDISSVLFRNSRNAARSIAEAHTSLE